MRDADENGAQPEGWATRTIGAVLDAKYGKSLTARKRNGGDVPVYGSNGVVGHHDIAITDAPVIVIGRKGSVGAINYSARPAWPIDTTYFIDDFRAFAPRFLRDLLRSLRLGEMDRSTAIPGLSREQLYERELVVPPLAEQRRIAERLDAIEAHRAETAAKLESARWIVERFRSAVLAAACSGRLTEDWRERHEDAVEEPITELHGEMSPLFDAPESWRSSSLGSVAEIRGGIQVGARRKTGETLREVPYLRVANVQRGWLDLSEMKTIAVPDAKIAQLRLQPGDILFNEGGDRDKLGRGWVWEGQIEECIHQNHVFRARLRDKRFQPRFYSWFGNSFGARYFIDEGKQTVNLASLSKTRLARLPVPIPPVAEQQEIVRRVDTLLASADALTAQIEHVASTLERVSKASLAKALRGELLPTEAALAEEGGRDFESAEELLARVAKVKAKRPTRVRK